MQLEDPYGRKWPVQEMTIDVGRFAVCMECVQQFDDVLESFATSHPDDTDMIPYFADLWPSALGLAKYLEKKFDSLQGVQVIELGCGLGLPSVVAAMLGGMVTASDFHPDNLPYVRANAALNQQDQLSPVCMDWRTPDTDKRYDVVLGSDLLYEKEQVETLTSCIAKILKPGGVLLLADPVRGQLQSAFDSLEAHGFKCELTVLEDVAIIEGKRGMDNC